MSRLPKPPPLPASLARAAVDSLADAILILGADGGVIHMNPAAEELFGRSRDRAVGLPLRSLPGRSARRNLRAARWVRNV